MRKKKIIFIFPVLILLFFCAMQTFGIFRSSGDDNKTVPSAIWSVSRNHSSSSDSIDLVKGQDEDDYTLTVESRSEVDVTYSVIISDLPAGVEVDLDGVTYPQSNNEIRIDNVGAIYYSDQEKVKTHTLTFRATNEASIVAGNEIDIDVEFKQII